MVDLTKKRSEKIDAAFERKAQLTLPTLSIRGGGSFYVCFLGEPAAKKDLDRNGVPKLDSEGNEKKTVVATVYDLAHRKKAQLVMLAVLYSELNTLYPGGYSGLCFELEIPREIALNKKYKIPTIYEIHAPDWLDAELATLLPPLSLAQLHEMNEAMAYGNP